MTIIGGAEEDLGITILRGHPGNGGERYQVLRCDAELLLRLADCRFLWGLPRLDVTTRPADSPVVHPCPAQNLAVLDDQNADALGGIFVLAIYLGRGGLRRELAGSTLLSPAGGLLLLLVLLGGLDVLHDQRVVTVQGPQQVFTLILRYDVLHIEVLIRGQAMPDFLRVNGLHIHINLSGLGLDLGGLSFCLVHGSLLSLAQAPQRVELQLVGRLLSDVARGNASAEGHIQQVPQVRLQHQLLDALHEVVPVFQVTLAGSVHPSRGPAKQQGLRDVRQRRQHIAGCVDYVPHPAELSHLEVIALTL